MTQRVGQAFLDEAVQEQRLGPVQFRWCGRSADDHVQPGTAEAFGNRVQRYAERRPLDPDRAEGANPAAHRGQRLTRFEPGPFHLLPGAVGVAVPHPIGERQRHPDQGQPVTQTVVQIARSPRSFVGQHELDLGRLAVPDLGEQTGDPLTLAYVLRHQPGQDQPETEDERRTPHLQQRVRQRPPRHDEDNELREQEQDHHDDTAGGWEAAEQREQGHQEQRPRPLVRGERTESAEGDERHHQTASWSPRAPFAKPATHPEGRHGHHDRDVAAGPGERGLRTFQHRRHRQQPGHDRKAHQNVQQQGGPALDRVGFGGRARSTRRGDEEGGHG